MRAATFAPSGSQSVNSQRSSVAPSCPAWTRASPSPNHASLAPRLDASPDATKSTRLAAASERNSPGASRSS